MTSRFFIELFLLIFICYLLFGFWLFLSQRKFIYFPDNQDFLSCEGFQDAQKIYMDKTRAYLKKTSDKLVIVYHGNAGSACDRYFLKEIFEKKGYSYIFVEYSGYSNDTKNPSKKLLQQDVKNTIHFVETQKFKKIIIYGESIGTGVASYHASISSADGLIFIAPFDSILNFARKSYPVYPLGLMLKEDYDNIASLKDYGGKITIIHGSRDSVIPLERSRNLFKSLITSEKEFVQIMHADHNDIYEYKDTISAIENSLD